MRRNQDGSFASAPTHAELTRKRRVDRAVSCLLALGYDSERAHAEAQRLVQYAQDAYNCERRDPDQVLGLLLLRLQEGK